MIDINIFRKGNWVCDKFPTPAFILWDYNLDRIASGIRYSGISLNEQWLIKFAFLKNDTGNYNLSIGENDFLELAIDGWRIDSESSNEDISMYKNLEYAHQLQNLYFALTGKELTTDAGTTTVGTAKN